MSGLPETYAIVDTETTGMRPPFSRIIDIGIIRVENGVEVERFQTLLNPGVSIPSFIRRFTNISDEDLADAPTFDEVALKVEELLSNAVFVAHNAPFDYSFVQQEFARVGITWSAETLCSVRLSRHLYPKSKSHSLDAVIDRHSLVVSERHRALPDADAVHQFFTHLTANESSERVGEAVARAMRTTPTVARDSFNELTDGAGVYFFYGPEQELLYVGKSKHVKTRARSHFQRSTDRKELRLQKETATVVARKTSGELSALLLEAALIKSDNPLYNRALRKRKSLVVAKPRTDDAGYHTVDLVRTVNLDERASLLGIFRTLTQAKETLRTLVRDYSLCPKLLGIEPGQGACFQYQLGKCKGACVGKESSDTYNSRVDEVFSTRKVRTWPYNGPVLIDEKENEHTGTFILIDDWVLYGAFRYEGDEFEPLIQTETNDVSFDYDTYKILARYLLKPQHARSIRALTKKEFTTLYNRAMGTHTFEDFDEPVIR